MNAPRNRSAAVILGALAGATAVNALVTVVAIRATARRGDRYVQGVQATVDRLAVALPPQKTQQQ